MSGLLQAPRRRPSALSALVAYALTMAAALAGVNSAATASTPTSATYSTPVSLDPGVPVWGVSCVAGKACIAVDNAGNVFGFSSRGSLRIGAGHLPLYGIACASQDFCVVVDGTSAINLTPAGERMTDLDPDLGQYGFWQSVSCSSADFCVVGGSLGKGHGSNTGAGIVSTWNGRTWSRATIVSPAPRGRRIGLVEYLSCASAQLCMAGDGEGRTSEWNGRRWSDPQYLATSIGPHDGTSFSCPSVRFCMALDGLGEAFTWNGHRWSAAGKIEMNLAYGLVACISAHSCVEVDSGGYGDTWNGKSWAGRTLIDPPSVSFQSISCLDSGVCVAVDRSGNAVVIELPNHSVHLPSSCFISGCISETV
jgi:hypothetical protein